MLTYSEIALRVSSDVFATSKSSLTIILSFSQSISSSLARAGIRLSIFSIIAYASLLSIMSDAYFTVFSLMFSVSFCVNLTIPDFSSNFTAVIMLLFPTSVDISEISSIFSLSESTLTILSFKSDLLTAFFMTLSSQSKSDTYVANFVATPLGKIALIISQYGEK